MIHPIDGKFNFTDSVMTVTISTSLVAVICFVFGVFKPHYPMVAGVLIGVLLLLLAGYSAPRVRLTHLLLTAAILIVALAFRLMPFNYVMGGQDQGVYVNMSAHYQKQGAPFFTDDVRESIDSRDIKKIYDDSLFKRLQVPRKIDGMYEGGFAPGVYIKDWDASRDVFQFYHLHPLWMAMFAANFGSDARLLSLTFFSLLSILGFYCLSLELSNNRTVAFLTAFFIAINPLHAFFSKFPVSEVPALAFSSFGFYYMARMWNSLKKSETVNGQSWKMYCLSLGCFFCFFLTRISGFMYIPLFLSLCLGSLIYLSDKRERRFLSSFFIILMLLYLLSVCYGLYTSFPYSMKIYAKTIGKLGHQYGIGVLSALIAISISILALAQACRFNEKFISFLKKTIGFGIDKIPIILFVILAIGLLKLLLLGYTDYYIGNGWLNNRWGIVHKELSSLGHGSIVVAVKYISPFLFCIFLVFIYDLNKTFFGRIILLFLAGFWFYIAFLLWTIPYEFYYARYLLSEIVPYTILAALLGVATVHQNRFKGFLIAVMLLSSGYFLYSTSLQLGYDVSRNPKNALDSIAEQIAGDDLLLITGNLIHVNQVVAPMRFYYDKNIFKFNNWHDFIKIVKSQDAKKYSSLCLLAGGEYTDDHFILKKSVNFEYIDYTQRKIGLNPFRRQVRNAPFYLYGIDLKKVAEINTYERINPRMDRNLNLTGFHSDKYWTNGDAAIEGLSIDMHNGRAGVLAIEMKGWRPGTVLLKKDKINVYINDTKLELKKMARKIIEFSIPATIGCINEIRIVSSTFVPADLGINDDKRILGIDIDEIKLWNRPL